MVFSISALDANGHPVQNALLTFYRQDKPFNVVAFPGNTGTLYFDSANDASLFAEGVVVAATAPGYNRASTQGSVIVNYNSWVFTMRPDNLNRNILIGAGLGLAVVAAAAGRKKTVGKFDFKNDALPYVVPAALIIGGVVVYNTIFGKSKEDKARDQALQNDIDAAGAPTLSDSELAAIANAIKEDLGYSWVSNDQTDAVRQLCRVRNTADVLRLVQAYGTHYITTFGIPRGKFTLEETVASQLSQDNIDFVNRYYDAQGITFKF